MKKKIFAIVLTLILVFATLPLTGCAVDYRSKTFTDIYGETTLSFDEDKYTITKTSSSGYFKTITKSAGTYENNDGFWTFFETENTKETFAFDTLLKKEVLLAEKFFGRSFEDRVIMTSKFDHLYMDGNIIEFALPYTHVSSGCGYDFVFAKNSTINDITRKVGSQMVVCFDGVLKETAFSSSEILSCNTSKVGETTLVYKKLGTTFSFKTLVTSTEMEADLLERPAKLYLEGFDKYTTIPAGCTVDEWKDLWKNDISARIRPNTPSKYATYIEAKDISVTNWKANSTTDSISFVATLSTYKYNRNYSCDLKIKTFSSGQTKQTISFDNTKIQDVYIVPKNDACTLFLREFNMSDNKGQGQNIALSSLIDITTSGLKTFCLNKGTVFEEVVGVYVYSENERLIGHFSEYSKTFFIDESGVLSDFEITIRHYYNAGENRESKKTITNEQVTVWYSDMYYSQRGFTEDRLKIEIEHDNKTYVFNTTDFYLTKKS